MINQPVVQRNLEPEDERISAIRTVKSTKKGTTLFNEDGEVRDTRFKAILDDPAFEIDPNQNQNINDSLLVPKDSITLTPGPEKHLIDEEEVPFEERSKSLKQRKKTRVNGPTEFHFVPKSKQSKRFKKK